MMSLRRPFRTLAVTLIGSSLRPITTLLFRVQDAALQHSSLSMCLPPRHITELFTSLQHASRNKNMYTLHHYASSTSLSSALAPSRTSRSAPDVSLRVGFRP